MLELFTKTQTFLVTTLRLENGLELKREDGQALVEYALILALIAVISIGVLTALGQGVSSELKKIADKLPTS